MIRTVRRKLGDPISPESIERLERLAEMPASEIWSDLIPERRFDRKLAAERLNSGWTHRNDACSLKKVS